ncbi:uncharacterized protein N7459_000141 [Penicillium hispanicum]|uniref:uncharacterized protein n=1 Tax=Penicillium hispanicum TaxID=1080232 RepID=UPI00253FC4A4|nr:uncharacterized protein N7459_000141 [Penicillium hispanicum]KAJ5593933.1 hypothetical protein N7459_000141 [Penicillium hispanicum]
MPSPRGPLFLSLALTEAIQQTPKQAVIIFIPLDTCEEFSVLKSIEHVPVEVHGKGLDILINCAGVSATTNENVAAMSGLGYQLSVNAVGVHHLISGYLPFLQKGRMKKVINISTIYPSMTWAQRSDFAFMPAYKISKAVLNALTVQYALSYKEDGFTFVGNKKPFLPWP